MRELVDPFIHRVGTSMLEAAPQTFNIRVKLDTDGDGLAADVDLTLPSGVDAGAGGATDADVVGIAISASGCGCQRRGEAGGLVGPFQVSTPRRAWLRARGPKPPPRWREGAAAR